MKLPISKQFLTYENGNFIKFKFHRANAWIPTVILLTSKNTTKTKQIDCFKRCKTYKEGKAARQQQSHNLEAERQADEW